MIAENSNEAQETDNCAQNGGFIYQAHLLIMQHQIDEGVTINGRSYVAGVAKRMKQKKVSVKKGKQGSLDTNSA